MKKGSIHSEKTKLRMSLAKIGHVPWNKNIKTGISWNRGQKGRQLYHNISGLRSHNVGEYRHSEEVRKKISLAHTGKKLSKEHKRKLSLFWIGKKKAPFSEEHKRKIGLAGKGRKLSEETKIKMSESRKGRTFNEQWKENMRKARLHQVFPNKTTSIELKLQNFLKEQGIEFQTNYPILGQPDIFIKPNICIFADGCYWHSCPECKKNNKENKRDEIVTKTLQSQGYTVIRIWEHDINNNIEECFNKIQKI